MRQVVIVAAVVAATAASWATVIIAQSPKNPGATGMLNATDLMQQVKDAKNLADEKADPVD